MKWILHCIMLGLCTFGLSAPASAQAPGTVLSSKKISASVLLPLNAGDQLGRSVARLSIPRATGPVSLVVGAQGDDDGGTNGMASDVGAVYVLRLSTTGNLDAVTKISATSGNFTGILNDKDFFGKAVCSIGDFNGDGFGDIAVGASRDDDGGSSRGAVWILYLDMLGAVQSHAKISDTSGNFIGALNDLDEFGSGVSPLGDLDGDGTLDLIVGSRLDDDGGTGRGAAYILFLEPDGSVREWTKISSTSGGLVGPLKNDDSFGQAVAGIGDLDGDGIPDAVVGATKDDDGALRNGAIWVLFLNRDGTIRAEQKISALAGGFQGPLTGSDEFGNTIAGLGDIDGDGINDLAVGAIFDQDISLTVETGCVWILFMNADGTVKGEQKINEFEGGFEGNLSDAGEFGEAIHSLGDFDGDGKIDIIVGERFRDDNQPNSGAIWLLSLDGVLAAPLDAEFTSSVSGGFWPLDVEFSDASFGDDRQWTWDFGDGTVSYERNPMHTYTAAGSYTVVLRVDGPVFNNTETKLDFIVVTDPILPIAEFVGAPLSVESGDPVTFTDLSTGSITSWAWDFGDATSSTLQNPVHVYTVDGTYDVSLTATGPAGSDLLTKFAYVVVDTTNPPVVEFSASPLSADAGVSIDFSDESTGFVSSWSWDFGDGQVSTVQHPSHAYDNPGTYDVSLAASGPGGSDSLTKLGYITVSVPPPPIAAFQASANTIIAGVPVTFLDTSAGQVLDWFWKFGDGVTSSLQDPVHVYAAGGIYRVSLLVGNDGGSSSTLKRIMVLSVSDGGTVAQGSGSTLNTPNPSFSASPTSGSAPLNVFFTDMTPGNPVGWSWDFGDGSTSTLQNPNYSYATQGTYTVSLSATAAGGGIGTLVADDIIMVLPDPPVADFTADITSGTAPLGVQFTDLSSSVVDSWVWNFGDGMTSTAQNPFHTYTFAGTFSVTLTVTGPGGGDVLNKPAFIVVTDAPPTADFVADVTSGGEPLTVFFTELASGVIDTYSWDFGDGASSTQPNTSHIYASAGTYSVALTVVGPGGMATESKLDYIVVNPTLPVAGFAADVTQGQTPLNVQFTDASSGSPTSWSWDFGDGGTSTTQSPLYSYLVAGTYTVSLTATNTAGNDAEVKLDFIMAVAPPPVADFTADVTQGQIPLDVQFTDTSTESPTSWLWDFGDGGTSTTQSPLYSYLVAGTYTVSLTATNASGSDADIKLDFIMAVAPPPVADFTADVTQGLTPLSVQFTDTSTEIPTSWLWDFGDGGTSTTQSPLYSYLVAGTYTVSLTAINVSGSDDEIKLDFILAVDTPPTAGFSADVTSGIAPLAVQFSDLSLGHVDQWTWDFGDGTNSTLASPAHTFLLAGTFTVALTVSGAGGMDTDTQLDLIVVSEPAPSAEFSADITLGDAPLDVQFTDLSTGTVSAWSWDLGDGSSSSQESPFHTFATPGTFDIALTATGPGGMDTNQKIAYIVATTPPAPVADFVADLTVGSAPLSVQFSDLTSGQVDSWSWDFGDGGSSTLANPAYVYVSTGTYTVALTATGLGGNHTDSKLDYIQVTLGPGGGQGGFRAVNELGGRTLPDGGRLPSARWTRRNGTGINSLCLDALRAPSLGERLELKLSQPLGQEVLVTLLLSDSPSAPIALSNGELLLDPGGTLLWVSTAITGGGDLLFERDLPQDLSLAGRELSAQARISEPNGVRWTNAVDLLLGL